MNQRIRICFLVAALSSVAPMIFASDPERRKYSPVELLVNTTYRGDGRFDGKNGCSKRIDVFNGGIKCGYPGRVSNVTHKFLRSFEKGDVYKMTREYPLESDAAVVETKEITYAGKTLTLWEGDHQKIILRPGKKEESEADPARQGADGHRDSEEP